MNILAIDTAGRYLSVAVAKGDKVVAKYTSKSERSHSDMIASVVERLLKNVGANCRSPLRPRDIDLYAVSIGPGSFTGLRIAVAFVKGMNLFFNKPVVAVPTLDAMASQIKADIVCPIVDAKRANVYTAIYKNGRRILKYSVIPIAEILGKLDKAVFTGDGIDVYRDEIIKALGKKAVFADRKLWHTTADIIAKIGFRMYNKNKGVIRDLSRLQPMYLYPRDIQCVRRQQR